MKKFLTIAVAFIYLAISSGLILEIHYCMGKEAGSSVKFAGNATPRCGKCGMENGPHKCCHNELKLIKVQDSHQQASLDYQCQAPEVPVQLSATSHWPVEARQVVVDGRKPSTQ